MTSPTLSFSSLSFSLKPLGELISLYMTRTEDWDLIACLEGADKGGNLVRSLLSRLTSLGGKLGVEEVRFPVFCRVCERLGAFLWIR